MYSNNTFFLFYLLLFVTSKRKIQLDPSNFIITFSPTCTKSSVYPKITSSSSPLRSRRPPPSRYARAVREWSTGMSPDQTYRLIEQPFWTMKRNKFNEADGACRAGPAGAWKSGRRTKLSSNVARFKKGEEKREGGERGRKDEGGEGTRHVALRQFFLMDGHGLSTLYTRWRCRNRLARSAKIIRSSSVKCNKRGANVQRGWVGGEGNCNIKFVGAWNALKFVSFEYLIIRGAKKKGKKESNQREGLFSFSTEKNNSLSRSRV